MGDARPIYGVDAVRQRIDTGFTGDLGAAPTMGHTVPLEGEIIKTPACVSEGRAGEACAK